MKRNVNIIPLSRDHHQALLFCWKIRQGMAKGVSAERIRAYIRYFWKDHLEKHFQEEEDLLFLDGDDPMCRHGLEDHGRIRDLINIAGGTSETDPEVFRSLADLVESHVRFEERQLFPHLEQKLSAERLSEIGIELGRLHENPYADEYEDVFWN